MVHLVVTFIIKEGKMNEFGPRLDSLRVSVSARVMESVP
jgi:hypothetical protein